MNKSYITHSEKETYTIAQEFTEKLQPGDIVFLKGDLGSGKTTFVKGIAQALGVVERVISPTFTVVRRHKTADPAIRMLYHLDLYRLEGSKHDTIGISDMKEDKGAVMFIEWPEYTPVLLTPTWTVSFEGNDNTNRTISFVHHT